LQGSRGDLRADAVTLDQGGLDGMHYGSVRAARQAHAGATVYLPPVPLLPRLGRMDGSGGTVNIPRGERSGSGGAGSALFLGVDDQLLQDLAGLAQEHVELLRAGHLGPL